MSRQYESRGYSNGEYEAPRVHRRRSSFDPGRRGGGGGGGGGPPPRQGMFEDENVYRTLRLTNLNPRVSDREVSDTVYREFRNFGEYNVKVTYYGDQRLAFVNFRYPEDAEAAMREFYNRLVLFDVPVRIGAVYPKPPPPRAPFVDRYDRGYSPGRRPFPEQDFYPRRDFYPRGGEFDGRLPPPPRDNIVNRQRHLHPEDDHYATRTLFVGNVDPDISAAGLKAVFDEFGYVEDVDIKKPPHGNGNPYAFIRYFNLDMAHTAKVKLSGKFIGPYQCKIGYGKPIPTSCIWVGGIGPWISKHAVVHEFERFGPVKRVVWPDGRDYAYIAYDNVESAKDAVEEMRGVRLKGAEKKLRTDFSDVKHMDSELNSKSFKQYKSLDSRRLQSSRSRSISRSSGRSSGTGSSAGSAKRHKRRRTKETRRGSKRHRQESNDDRYSDDLFDERNVKKKRRRSGSASSDGSMRSEGSNPRYQSGPGMENNAELFDAKTVADLSTSLPVVWTGSLSLKNNVFFVNFHSVVGSPGLVDMLLCDARRTRISNLKLTQRLRMDPPKLDEVRRRIQLSGNEWCALLALPGTCNPDSLVGNMQERPIKNLVTYLRQKEAAGVLSLPPNSAHGLETGLLHTFAPCEFAHKYLLQRAPNLELDAQAEEYVVVILVRVNI